MVALSKRIWTDGSEASGLLEYFSELNLPQIIEIIKSSVDNWSVYSSKKNLSTPLMTTLRPRFSVALKSERLLVHEHE